MTPPRTHIWVEEFQPVGLLPIESRVEQLLLSFIYISLASQALVSQYCFHCSLIFVYVPCRLLSCLFLFFQRTTVEISLVLSCAILCNILCNMYHVLL